MAKDISTKKKYIDAAYSLICQEELDQINIRKIANLTGFSVGNLYRHFASLDELLLYATALYFRDYFIATEEMCRTVQNAQASIEPYLDYERLFAHYSFYHPHLMYNLYFGTASGRTSYIIEDCLRIYFPDTGNSSEITQEINSHQALEERYLDILQLFLYRGSRPADTPLILLNVSIFYMYQGFLQEALRDPQYASHAEQRKARYISCVQNQLELFAFRYPDHLPFSVHVN